LAAGRWPADRVMFMAEKRGLPDQDVLDEIETRSKEIMRSNDELAAKLRQNQELLTRFSGEFESLKADLGGEPLDLPVKRQLEQLRSELEEKKLLISDMIDDLKPVELDLARREDEMAAFRQRIDDQAKKIESLSKDVLDNRKQSESLLAVNNELKKAVAERDGMVKVLKDKLAEKTTLLKGVDEKNRSLEQQADSYRKQVFALDNKVKAIEGRVFATDGQNQKLLYEMMRQNERLKALESRLAEKEALLESKEAEYAGALEAFRKEEYEKKAMIMQSHAKRMAVLNATIDALKSKLMQQQKVVEEKSVREREIISDFSTKMREILSARAEVRLDDLPHFSEAWESAKAEMESAVEQADFNFSADEDNAAAVDEFSDPPKGPSKMDEIIPMIELAMEHGDDIRKIKHSLLSSGYSQKEVSAALSRLNILEN
jgi:chromosome segregation ATPase